MNSFEDFHCAGLYLPVNKEKKNEGKELSKTGEELELCKFSHCSPSSFVPSGGGGYKWLGKEARSA